MTGSERVPDLVKTSEPATVIEGVPTPLRYLEFRSGGEMNQGLLSRNIVQDRLEDRWRVGPSN